MTRLALLRHGETEWNAEHRLQGQRDIGLSPRGRAQVRRQRQAVRDLAPTLVLRSPLLRCRETTDELQLVGDTDARWVEADLGQWTGLTRAELVARGDGGYLAWRAGEHTPPGGETLEQLRDRIDAALADVRAATAPGSTTLVVTHGGPIRAVCHLLLGLRTAQLVPAAPASLTVFDLSGATPRLAGYNITTDVPSLPTGEVAEVVPARGGADVDPPD